MSTWEQLIANLNVWKRGAEVAPHMPLLTLITDFRRSLTVIQN